MKFNKGKYKVSHVSQGNPKQIYKLGREGIENSPEKTWECRKMKILTPLVSESLKSRKPTILNQKKVVCLLKEVILPL